MATGDDCFALKAGRNADGLRAGAPVENVVFRHNHATGGFGGVTCGSETAAGIRNIYVRDCVFENVRHAAYFKTRRPRGGGGERFWAERIAFSASSHAIFFDMLGAPMYVGELAHRLPPRPVNQQTPFYRDITLRHFAGRCAGDAFKIKGIPESPATRITLEHCDIESHGLINLADATDIEVLDSHFAAAEPTIKLLDVAGAQFERVVFDEGESELALKIAGEQSQGVRFLRCRPPVRDDSLSEAGP